MHWHPWVIGSDFCYNALLLHLNKYILAYITVMQHVDTIMHQASALDLRCNTHCCVGKIKKAYKCLLIL